MAINFLEPGHCLMLDRGDEVISQLQPGRAPCQLSQKSVGSGSFPSAVSTVKIVSMSVQRSTWEC